MATNLSLSGDMIMRSVKRHVDDRLEERVASSATAALSFRGRKYVVRLVNISSAGAMMVFPLVPAIDEPLVLQLLDGGAVQARVRWVRDGRIGVSFEAAPE